MFISAKKIKYMTGFINKSLCKNSEDFLHLNQ